MRLTVRYNLRQLNLELYAAQTLNRPSSHLCVSIFLAVCHVDTDTQKKQQQHEL